MTLIPSIFVHSMMQYGTCFVSIEDISEEIDPEAPCLLK